MINPESSKLMQLRHWFNRLFIIIVFTVIGVSIFDNWAKIISFTWQLKPFGIVLAIFIYMVFFFLRGIVWIRITHSLNIILSMRLGLRIYIYSYISRYIPGGIWLFVTLNTYAHDLGLSKRVFTISLIINILLLLIVDLIYFMPFIVWFLGLVGILIYCVSLYFMPLVFRMTLDRLSRFRIMPNNLDWEKFTHPQNIFRLFNLTIVHQVFQLLSYFVFIHSMIALSTSQIAYISIAYAISWLIGFLIIFVPQGLGVREATFIVLTAPLISGEVAIALSVALRLLTIVSELIVFFVFLVYDKYYQRRS